MKYFTITVEEKEYNFRLTSNDCIEIEKKSGQPLQNYIQDISNTRCVSLLKYMSKTANQTFTDRDANELFDTLVDNGYSLEKIYLDIIFPACVVSGLLTQSNLDSIREAVNNPETTKAMQK